MHLSAGLALTLGRMDQAVKFIGSLLQRWEGEAGYDVLLAGTTEGTPGRFSL